MNRFLHAPFAVLTIALSLAGCNSADSPLPGEVSPASHKGDAEELRAAQSLSIGNARAIDDDLGPYIQALRCTVSLDAINERFVDSSGLSEELKNAMLEAQAIYEREVAKAGEEEGKSGSEIQSDLDEQAKRIPEMSTRGQIAIGCLRKLT